MRVIKCKQGTAEWLNARRGKITASRIADVMDFLKKGGEGASRRNYRIELMAERLTGRSEDHYVTPEMAWGSEYESRARAAYEVSAGVMVDQVGFVLHPIFDYAGASPDSLVGEDGGLEIKCPKTSTHLKWMMAGEVPEEHQGQMYWNMLCCEREWWDFVSYDPRLPRGLQIFTKRLERDEARINQIEEAVVAFNGEVEDALKPLQALVVKEPMPEVDTRSSLEQLNEMLDRMEMIP
jgi:putative phage-type endonuclease